MIRASEELRFEDAAHFRDQINFLERHPDVQGLVATTQTDDDIVGFYRESNFVEFVVLFSRGGSIIDKSGFYFNNASWKMVRHFENFSVGFTKTIGTYPIEL